MGKHELRFLVAFHILLGFSSTLGNAVILAALSKATCLHPPSKILLRSLALTDLCVGLLLEPLFASVVITIENDNLKLCVSINLISSFITEVFSLVSLVTLTATSLDRLLALLLGIRYRQVVTFKRTLMIMTCMWTLIFDCQLCFHDILEESSQCKLILYYYSCSVMYNGLNLLLHQDLSKAPSSPSSNTRTRSPRTTKRTYSIKHSEIQKNIVQCIVGAVFSSCMLPSHGNSNGFDNH